MRGRGRCVDFVWHTMNTLWWRVVMSFLAGSFLCPPAKAQSFFESLFGIGGGQPKAERAVPKAGVRMGTRAQSFSDWKAERFQSSPADGDGYRRDPAYGGSYKTVCVRTCDGYYWPISRSVTSERFATDEKRCDAACVGEAKLFYQHKNSDDPKSMIALDGTPYTALKTAFLYRKTLISGCGCKPAPWSVAESYRHQEYKAADDAKKLQIAMAREREKAEALRRDKIAQIIAATREAVLMDEAEEATFGEAVTVAAAEVPDAAAAGLQEPVAVAVVEIETNPDVSVTGYVHLHVLPDAVLDAEMEEPAAASVAETGLDVATLETAFAEIAGATLAPKTAQPEPVKTRVKTKKPKSAKPVKTVSLFGGPSNLTWPGDAPQRR